LQTFAESKSRDKLYQLFCKYPQKIKTREYNLILIPLKYVFMRCFTRTPVIRPYCKCSSIQHLLCTLFFYQEIESILTGFNRSIPATPPTGAPYETSQKALWRKYISWEKTNPLKLDDRNMVIKRGILICLYIAEHLRNF